MPCYTPLTGYYSADVGSSGKRGITFIRSASFSGVPLRLPCGQCIGCRLERSRQWAVRCMHERQLHAENVFVTLTYEDVPEGNTLVKRDLQLFMKRLRKKYGAGVRFYACGEYGDTTYRPHYHAILFNHWFDDRKFFKRGKRDGEVIFTSAKLDDIWGLGQCTLGDVTFDSAAYVARYVVKKITGPDAWQAYQWVDASGVIHDRVPEFTNMSRRPGIGSGWFAKFGNHSYAHDSVVMNGVEMRPPRFYDTRYELLDSDRLSMLKLARRRKAMKRREDNTPDRRRVREYVELKRLSQWKRDL